MHDPLRIILVKINTAPEVITVEHEVSVMQALIGGDFKPISLAGRVARITGNIDKNARGITLWCRAEVQDDDGRQLPRNRILGPFLVLDDTGLAGMVPTLLIYGDFFLAAHEDGRAVSLTDKEVIHWLGILAESGMVTREGSLK